MTAVGEPLTRSPAVRLTHQSSTPPGRHLIAESPWAAAAVYRTAGVVAGGVILQVACWNQLSNEVVLERQLPWVAGAIAAATCCGLAGAGWLVAGFRAVRGALLEVTARLDLPVVEPSADAAATTEVFVTAAGMQRFHRASCPLMVGKRAAPVEGRGAGDSELLPCGVCDS